MKSKFKITLIKLIDGDEPHEQFMRSITADHVRVDDLGAVTTFTIASDEKALIGVPIPMLLICPDPRCSMRHIDEGEFATKPHHTHACQGCGMVWRPALVPTVGVQYLPGFKNDV